MALREYKCPCCNGAVLFDSSLQKMKCQYCDTVFEMDALESLEAAFDSQQPDNINLNSSGEQFTEEDGIFIYTCKSCGGEIVTDSTTAAFSCPYCDNPVTVTGRLSGAVKPDLIIPFKLDKEAAKKAYIAHLSDKKLLPKVFKNQNHIDEIKGVYVPFWIFDAEADVNANYRGIKSKTWVSGHYQYTKQDYYNIIRNGGLKFKAVPVDASTKFADDLMDSLEPFNYDELVDFKSEYLSGYLADRYDVDAAASMERLKNRVKHTSETVFQDTVSGYTSVEVQSSSVRTSPAEVKYALLPVWLMNTVWNDTRYVFAMNGQTGKMVGDLPINKPKQWLTVLITLAILIIIQK